MGIEWINKRQWRTTQTESTRSEQGAQAVIGSHRAQYYVLVVADEAMTLRKPRDRSTSSVPICSDPSTIHGRKALQLKDKILQRNEEPWPETRRICDEKGEKREKSQGALQGVESRSGARVHAKIDARTTLEPR